MDFCYDGDMKGMPSSDVSMLNAFGAASSSKGSELESPEENFIGRSMSQGALDSPANALGAVSGSMPPRDSNVFDCMADHAPKFNQGSSDNLG